LAKRVIIALLLGIVVAGFVVARDAARSDAKFTVVSGPPHPVLPTVMHSRPTRYRVVATPIAGAGSLYVQVGTYLELPKDTIILSVLDGRGRRIARCVFPPTSYTDNGKLSCPLPDITRAHGLIVARRGTAKIALYSNGDQAGFVVKNEAASFSGRVWTVLSRIAVPLPNGVGSTVVIVGLAGSVALTALALLLVLPLPSRRPAREEVADDDADTPTDRPAPAA
jgi:hypothetical protein